ncbi:MAG TPA: hypothetical protein VKU19_14425 [Bryobacteraceae bacterium]|nr:hypothetical protein [Bryobacteraceae bacterium]
MLTNSEITTLEAILTRARRSTARDRAAHHLRNAAANSARATSGAIAEPEPATPEPTPAIPIENGASPVPTRRPEPTPATTDADARAALAAQLRAQATEPERPKSSTVDPTLQSTMASLLRRYTLATILDATWGTDRALSAARR